MLPLLFLLSFSTALFAQDPVAADADTSKWKVEGFGATTINQVSFTNWAAGGDNSISFALKAFMTARYNSGRHHWDNGFNAEYGLLWTKAEGMRKNEDKIELETKYGYDINKKKTLLLSALGNFKSQFANGYNYPNDSIEISKFASPGYLTLALGIDWKPKDYFSVFVSPVTGKITFVTDQYLANTGIYGNEAGVAALENGQPKIDTTTGRVIFTADGEKVLFQFGAYLNARFQKEVVKNITVVSKLELFANYMGDTPEEKMIDVNWETALLFNINEWFAASLTLNLIYDKQTRIAKDENEDGKIELNEFDDRVQFKEALGLGLTYKFNNKKEPKP
ncbi:MAG: DUF3078 domain-containing protein [Chitinophagales bacterium]|nr:DUF3078 domain-containing protein [Chitinophagales bacterium]